MARLGRRVPFKPKLTGRTPFGAVNNKSLTGSVVASSSANANASAKPLTGSQSLAATYVKLAIKGNFAGSVTSTGSPILKSFPKALAGAIVSTGANIVKAISGAILSGGSITSSGNFAATRVFVRALQGGSIGSAGSTIAKILVHSRAFTGAYALVSLLTPFKVKLFTGSIASSSTLTSQSVLAPVAPIIDDYMEFFEEQP